MLTDFVILKYNLSTRSLPTCRNQLECSVLLRTLSTFLPNWIVANILLQNLTSFITTSKKYKKIIVIKFIKIYFVNIINSAHGPMEIFAKLSRERAEGSLVLQRGRNLHFGYPNLQLGLSTGLNKEHG
jgi:uracil phosphoribosyltransferase